MSGDVLNIPRLVPVFTQDLAQRRNVNAQRSLLDNCLGPHPLDELVLAHYRARAFDQADEDFARAAAQPHRPVAAQEDPLSWIEYEWSKGQRGVARSRNIECHDSTGKDMAEETTPSGSKRYLSRRRRRAKHPKAES